MDLSGLRRFLIVVIALTFFAGGCKRSEKTAIEGDDLVGTITISGAWALYPMVIRWSEEFQKIYPNVAFDISAGGAGKGMADALAGAADIGMVSREIYPEEVARGAFWVSVTKDAVFLTVDENNPVWDVLHKQGIKQQTLIDIYITGEVVNWGQVTGNSDNSDLIHVFTRSDACGAAATWAKYLGGAQEDLLGVGVYGDPGLLLAVDKDPLGMGYNNLNFAFDMDTGLPVTGVHIVPLDVNENGQADPDEIYDTKVQAVEAVASGRYPSPPTRDLNFVTQGQPVGLIKSFIVWVMTDGQGYVEEVGYIPLQEDMLSEELAKLD
ncbi:MAG: substrate-binding domain-containing protein [Anaerolineales bacterium]|nr:substrate-binding domain-containing protein [Anaerolineales bacterium]